MKRVSDMSSDKSKEEQLPDNEPAAMAKIPVGISSCLLGERVRFDGGHKGHSYITGTLGEYFEFKPFCP
ncbi:MAG: 2-thiouracil desulfurase family protein, partial [Pseudomonadales bacterium]|nr:2-thiouracil desulfurase family protein [Pseudomonadales bacterium]